MDFPRQPAFASPLRNAATLGSVRVGRAGIQPMKRRRFMTTPAPLQSYDADAPAVARDRPGMVKPMEASSLSNDAR